MKGKTSRIKMVLLVTLAALLISMILVPAGFAAIGVEEDDWVRYGVFAGRYQTYLLGETPPYGNLTDKVETVYIPPNLWNLTWPKPDYWPENNTEWIDMTFQSISGSNVTVNSTTHFENGAEDTKTLSGNVEIGSGNVGFFLIPANFSEGLEVPWDHTEVTGAGCAPLKLYVNGTVSRRYAGATREVNYVKILNYTGTGPTRVTLEAYWDKATGALCEISISVTYGPYSVLRWFIDAWTSFRVTETNMWGPGKELEDLTADYEALNTTKSDLEEEIADLEASVADLEGTVSMWQMLTVVLLIVGLAVGFIIAWVVKKPKT